MDIGKWGSGRSRSRFIRKFLVLCLCLLNQGSHHVSASESNYSPIMQSQNFKDESEKSRNNLDPLFEDEDYKRSSSFFPLRGKKFALDEPMSPHPMIMSEQESREDKRSQFFPLRGKKIPDELKRGSYFMPMRGRKDGWTDDYFDALDESDKRASSFMPMRGKKRTSDSGAIFPQLGRSGMYSNDLDEVMPLLISNIAPDKRTSSFVPVRGKRSETDPLRIQSAQASESDAEENNETSLLKHEENMLHHINKRSVSFMPMRGRSVENSSGYGGGKIATSLVDKKQYSFMPMRGRREPDVNDSFSDDFEDSDGLYGSSKRGASFMPMRGRRIVENDADDDDDVELDEESKRAQSFMPMRGRRLFYPRLPFNSDSDLKRASSFMPMRGRRTWDDELSEDNWTEDHSNPQFDSFDKKASSFTLMRGRRKDEESESEHDSLFSMAPEKRMSFTPMRGRRTFDQDREWPDASYDKKSSSFMPMRGRRTYEDEDLSDVGNEEKRSSSFMPMRGRRVFSELSDYNSYYHPYPILMAGIGSSLMSRPYGSNIRNLVNQKKKLKINWDSVKRAFHATRGKRQEDVNDFVSTLKHHYFSGMPESVNEEGSESENEKGNNSRVKRSIIRPRVSFHPQRQYLALKRPMSFFATRGKRFDDSTTDKDSKLH